MFDTKLSLISILAVLTVIVLISLTLDYLRLLRRPARLGLWLAMLGIIAGFVFTLNAVLPGNRFYGPTFSEVKTSQKIVALTFDDGPYPPYTGKVLDILREEEVPATFFVIGRNAARHPDLVRRMVAEGHQVGNHTYNHVDLLKADRATIADEVDRTNRVIAAITGASARVVRPPHGFRDAVVLEVMAERGLKVVEWSVLSRDWTNPGVDTIVRRTLDKVKSGAVILLHDGDGVAAAAPRTQTVEAARLVIRDLKARGFKFVTVDEILKSEE
ncbi:polysaccharide deacetylase family protein [Anaeroselena agilis]|uniref:Polysaccharide deacetylase family protein n=1 Tax=Anaeroselena agilis TaxID=3063788 RepID=A0ABU3P3W3_9FIRM|nr:polysaccharide deacetylase family protein [Selenomonadales bacterium 4137-cl]